MDILKIKIIIQFEVNQLTQSIIAIFRARFFASKDLAAMATLLKNEKPLKQKQTNPSKTA